MKAIIPQSILLWLCVSILALPAAFAASGKIVLKMNHQFPADAAGSQIDQWFADEVKRLSEGQLEIRIYWSNMLGEPRENLALLKNTAIDLAAMSAGYFPEELPFYSAPNSIPMAMDDICQSSAIMEALMTRIPAFKAEAARHRIRPLFFHLLNPYVLVTRTPVTKLADLKGMRIRTWGSEMPRLIRAAGAKPVSLFLPDIYEALNRGVIDGCPFALDLVLAYKLHLVARHVTEVILWEGPSWGVWISETTWQRLSPRHRSIMLAAAAAARQKEIPQTLAAEKNARRYLRNHGVHFHAFASAELERWKQLSPDFFGNFILRMKSVGLETAARQTVALWQQMRSSVHCP